MLEALGHTQQHLMRLLLAHKAGMSIDALATPLGVSRTAVRQHLSALEGLGWIKPAAPLATGGRPGKVFALSPRGYGVFPKQYGMLSSMVLQAMLNEKGDAGLRRWLGRLGRTVAKGFAGRTAGKPLKVRIIEAASVLNELSYQAKVDKSGTAIEASNCVYHELARNHRQVCRFDTALLETLTDATVTHQACMHDGADTCRFVFTPKA